MKNFSTATLNELANYTEAGGQTEFWAKNILTYYGAHYSPEYFFGEAAANENDESGEFLSNDMEEKTSIQVSPNPAKDFVNFRVQQVPESSRAVLDIIDINGRVLESYAMLSKNQIIRWDTKGYPSGIYFYRLLSNDGNVESGKIILSK